MMNGAVLRSKSPLIKLMLKQGISISEINKKMNFSPSYIRFIRNCLNNNLPTHFYKKRFRSRNPDKRNKERKENYDRGAKYDYCSRLSYSKQEEELILEFKGTDRELAKRIGRSVRAIQVKRTKMKKESGLIVEGVFDLAIS